MCFWVTFKALNFRLHYWRAFLLVNSEHSFKAPAQSTLCAAVLWAHSEKALQKVLSITDSSHQCGWEGWDLSLLT